MIAAPIIISSLTERILTEFFSKNYRKYLFQAFEYIEVILFALCLWFGPNDYVSVTVR